MIKILTILLFLSLPAYAAEGRGDIGAVLLPNVLIMPDEEAVKICEQNPDLLNCKEIPDSVSTESGTEYYDVITANIE